MMTVKNVVIVLADGFEEVEAIAPADVLKRLGCNVILAGLKDKTVTGAHGMKIFADAMLDGVDCISADAFVLPGGLPGATNLRDDARIMEILKKRDAAGKICAAICASPAAVLASAEIVKDRVITGYPGCEGLSKGETVTTSGAPAEISENLVTGKGPGAAFAFAAAIAKALSFTDDQIGKLFDGMFVAR